MNRNDVNRFAVNPTNLDISRSIFNRDHKMIFSANVGELIPHFVSEVLPGDTFNLSTAKVVRLQPLVTPIMDNLFLDTYYFFVPMRLVWNHTKEFFGENTSTAWVPNVSYTIPQITVPSGGFNVGTIADYMGVPPKSGALKTISALPFRAYALICNEWFRDENLMNPVHVHVDDSTRTGVNTGDQVTDIELGGKPFIVCKYFDYFTSCLPNAQKANGPMVEFALNGLLPVNAYDNKQTITGNKTYSNLAREQYLPINSSHFVSNQLNSPHDMVLNGADLAYESANFSGTLDAFGLTPLNLFADISNTSLFDINTLRQAFAIQRYYERSARGGTRYTEYIKNFFNVDSADARLQRPELLSAKRLPLNVNQVEQTSATEINTTPQGNLTGISHTGDAESDFVKSFTEHGLLIGLSCVRYHHTYQNGLERFWSRKTTFDFYNPVFANLGEQAVMEDEIYFDGANNVFGYQEAWADYRYAPSRVAGEMRSVATTPLDMWHLADNYTSQPYLSDSWIREDKAMLDRCLAVTSAVSNQYIADYYIQNECARPMPLYSIPGLIDHH